MRVEMAQVTIDEFRRRALRLSGQTLLTLRGRRPFRVDVVPEGLTIAPSSSGVERHVGWPEIDRFLLHFNTTGSLTPAHYHALTFNSSYLVALMKALTSP